MDEELHTPIATEAGAFDVKSFLARLTDLPGVYRMLDAKGEVLYVGKAKNLKKRVASYFRENLPSPRTALIRVCVGGVLSLFDAGCRIPGESVMPG